MYTSSPDNFMRKHCFYLEAFNASSQSWDVTAGLAARGIDVALDGILRLVAGLVECAQVHPGSRMAVVQLHCTNICLQCIHRLVLLLIQHTGDTNTAERNGKQGKAKQT